MAEKLVKDSPRLAKELVNDCISRQAAIHAICRDGVRLERGGALMITISTAKQWAVDLLGELPSAQPERKKGKWILTEDDNYEYCTCSECGYQNGENWMNGSDIPFCAVCGADMRGEQE